MGGRVVLYFGMTEEEIAAKKQAISDAKTSKQRLYTTIGMINMICYAHRNMGINARGKFPYNAVPERSANSAKHYARLSK